MAKRGRKKKRGRPKKKRLSAKQRLKQALNVTKKGKHRQFVYLKCKLCGKEWRLHVNDKDIYTDEVKKNFVGLCCK